MTRAAYASTALRSEQLLLLRHQAQLYGEKAVREALESIPRKVHGNDLTWDRLMAAVPVQEGD